MTFHYTFHHSWALIGKIAADIIVPSLMAWAGVHLAAEVKTGTERKLWQSVFAMLAIFGVVVGILVELQVDDDHTTEINEMKGTIGDLQLKIKVDMMTTMTDYNNAHPQNPVTLGQVTDLLKLYGRTVPVAVPQQLVPQNTQATARQLVAPQAVVPYHAPVIQSAPKMFSSTGQIVGTNIGPGGGRSLRIRVRVKESAQVGAYMQSARAGPDRLLADSEPLNYVYVSPKYIQQWTDNNIQLAFDSTFWQNLVLMVKRRADNIHATAPQPSDMEVGYQIYGPDGDSSNLMYVK
jgi:hypothetical protein